MMLEHKSKSRMRKLSTSRKEKWETAPTKKVSMNSGMTMRTITIAVYLIHFMKCSPQRNEREIHGLRVAGVL